MRFAEGQPECLPGLIEEVIRRKVDVLVVGTTNGARAAMSVPGTIPIVFAGSSDPVAGHVVTNLARQGGNITAFSLAYGDGFAGKWVELLKETARNALHIAALWDSSTSAQGRYVEELRTAAQMSKVRLDLHQAANRSEFDEALVAIGSGGRGV